MTHCYLKSINFRSIDEIDTIIICYLLFIIYHYIMIIYVYVLKTINLNLLIMMSIV